MSDNALLETIAAAVLDGMTVSFAPYDADGTQLPTGVVVGVRWPNGGQLYHNNALVGFGELSLSGAAEKMLVTAIDDTVEPVVTEALADRARDEALADRAPGEAPADDVPAEVA